jgi:hypothetical protein
MTFTTLESGKPTEPSLDKKLDSSTFLATAIRWLGGAARGCSDIVTHLDWTSDSENLG